MNARALSVDKLKVKVHPNRTAMGASAATDIAGKIGQLLLDQDELRIVFAAAPSQSEMLTGLALNRSIEWSKITAFHMDEYIGLPPGSGQSFQHFLRNYLFDKVRLKGAHFIDGQARDPTAECSRYSQLIQKAPIDIVCLGIGENGHIAFNDPPFANFNDPETAKIVKLDTRSREQQVTDGCFPKLDRVPTEAITLTVPALLAARFIFCVVPGPTKAAAIQRTLSGPIDENCPASILRTHANCTLYVDDGAYNLVKQ